MSPGTQGPMPRLGFGTWRMGESAVARAQELAALRLALSLGADLIDTAEMYGEGVAETLVGEALADHPGRVFLVTKFYPHHATRAKLLRALEASLARLGRPSVDLYLYHWRGDVPLAETVAALEERVAAGRIGRWGVSNFDVADMEELFATPGGDRCAANQVLYNLARRGVEYDLLPWCRERGVALMAYSALDDGRLAKHPAVLKVASRVGATAAQVALAWAMREPGVTALAKASRPEHVRANRAALDLRLDRETLDELDRAFPVPRRKVPLAVY